MRKNDILNGLLVVENVLNGENVEMDMADYNGFLKNLVEGIREYLDKGNGNKDIENGRCGELLKILRENKQGIGKERIMEVMGINKGNLASLVVYLRKGGIDIVRIGNKIILGEYVKLG